MSPYTHDVCPTHGDGGHGGHGRLEKNVDRQNVDLKNVDQKLYNDRNFEDFFVCLPKFVDQNFFRTEIVFLLAFFWEQNKEPSYV